MTTNIYPAEISNCHYAPVKLVGGIGDFSDHEEGVTMHYECTECGEACDLYSPAKPTLQDVVQGTPAGQKAVEKALEKSAEVMQRTTDLAEQEAWLDKLLTFHLLKHANDFVEYIQNKRPEPSVSVAVADARAAILEHLRDEYERGRIDELKNLASLPNVYPEKIKGQYTHVEAIFKSAITNRLNQLKQEDVSVLEGEDE